MSKIEIEEVYKNPPPIDFRRSVEKLLAAVPEKYLGGLRTVVIRDSASLNYDRRRQKTRSRKKKYLTRESCGLYHPAWGSEPAWIELFIDNIFDSWLDDRTGRIMLKIPLCRETLLGETLYHEIGHHIHSTKAPEHKEKEDVAEKCKKKLSRSFLLRHHWYVAIPIMPIAWLSKKLEKRRKRLGRQTK